MSTTIEINDLEASFIRFHWKSKQLLSLWLSTLSCFSLSLIYTQSRQKTCIWSCCLNIEIVFQSNFVTHGIQSFRGQIVILLDVAVEGIQEVMAENSLSCYQLPDPTFHKVAERYTMNLVTAIINMVTAPLAVISNLLIFAAIVSRLRAPSKILIASWPSRMSLLGLQFSRVTLCTDSWKISIVPFPALSELYMQMLFTFVVVWLS